MFGLILILVYFLYLWISCLDLNNTLVIFYYILLWPIFCVSRVTNCTVCGLIPRSCWTNTDVSLNKTLNLKLFLMARQTSYMPAPLLSVCDWVCVNGWIRCIVKRYVFYHFNTEAFRNRYVVVVVIEVDIVLYWHLHWHWYRKMIYCKILTLNISLKLCAEHI